MVSYRQIIGLNLYFFFQFLLWQKENSLSFTLAFLTINESSPTWVVHLQYIPHNLSRSIKFNKLTWDFAVSTALTHNIPHSTPTENGRQVVETKTLCCGTSRWYFSHPLFTSLRVNQWRSTHVGFPRTLAMPKNVMFTTSTFRMPKFIFQKDLTKSNTEWVIREQIYVRPVTNGKYVV